MYQTGCRGVKGVFYWAIPNASTTVTTQRTQKLNFFFKRDSLLLVRKPLFVSERKNIPPLRGGRPEGRWGFVHQKNSPSLPLTPGKSIAPGWNKKNRPIKSFQTICLQQFTRVNQPGVYLFPPGVYNRYLSHHITQKCQSKNINSSLKKTAKYTLLNSIG